MDIRVDDYPSTSRSCVIKIKMVDLVLKCKDDRML
jgi:hypothetical protein